MIGPTEPRHKLEICWYAAVSDPVSSLVFTDITQHLRSGHIGGGRNRQIDRWEPTRATFTLDSMGVYDGKLVDAFNATNLDGPFAGQMRALARVRHQVWWADGTYRLFHGFLRQAPHSRPSLDARQVTLECVDVSTVVNRTPLPPSPYAIEISLDKPLHWWKLGAATSTISDSGSRPWPVRNYYVTSGSALTIGGRPGVADGDPVISDPGGAGSFDGESSFVDAKRYPHLPTPPWAVEIPFKCDYDSVFPPTDGSPPDPPIPSSRFLFSQTDAGNGPTSGRAGVYMRVHATPDDPLVPMTGRPAVGAYDSTTGLIVEALGPINVADGQPHLMRAKYDGTTLTMYIDGAVHATVAVGGIRPFGTVCVGAYAASVPPHSPWKGEIGDVTIYQGDAATTNARARTHYLAWATAWSGDSPGQRINRLLDYAGLPQEDRIIGSTEDAIGFGMCRLGPASFGGKILDHISDVADSDGGAFLSEGDVPYIYRGREYLISDPRSREVQATFTDKPPDAEHPEGYGVAYDLPLDLPIDDELLWNRSKVTRAGGAEQVVNDLAAQARDGVREESRTGMLYETDDEAFSAAHRLQMRAGPQSNLNTLNLLPNRDRVKLYPLVLRTKYFDRIAVILRPDLTDWREELIVQGIDHDFVINGEWTTALSVSPADPNTYHYIGDPIGSGVLA